jgi:hypothetical protein
LLVYFELHEQFFSNVAVVTITGDHGDRAANLDQCLALTAFSSKDSFTVISERPVILTSECHAHGKRAITTYFKRLKFEGAGMSRARIHYLPDAKREHYH